MTSPLFVLITLFVTVSGPAPDAGGLPPGRARDPAAHVAGSSCAALANLLVYTEAKNLVNRIAHLKQLRGEHQWVVTPRNAASTGSSGGSLSPDHAEEARETEVAA